MARKDLGPYKLRQFQNLSPLDYVIYFNDFSDAGRVYTAADAAGSGYLELAGIRATAVGTVTVGTLTSAAGSFGFDGTIAISTDATAGEGYFLTVGDTATATNNPIETTGFGEAYVEFGMKGTSYADATYFMGVATAGTNSPLDSSEALNAAVTNGAGWVRRADSDTGFIAGYNHASAGWSVDSTITTPYGNTRPNSAANNNLRTERFGVYLANTGKTISWLYGPPGSNRVESYGSKQITTAMNGKLAAAATFLTSTNGTKTFYVDYILAVWSRAQ